MPDPDPDDGATPTPDGVGSPVVAESQTPETPAAGDDVVRARMRAALLRPSRAQLTVAVLLAAVGFAAITQVHTNRVDDTYAGYREQDLVDVLSSLAGTSQRAQTEINRLQATRRQLEANSAKQGAAVAEAEKQASDLSILAGIVPVSGPGIRITVTEGARPVDVGSILDTIEELRSAGAESMAFNGRVRLVAQSSVQAIAGGLEIDGTKLTSPYVIDVIGDPHTLEGALTLAEGPISQFKDAGAQVDVSSQNALDITAVR